MDSVLAIQNIQAPSRPPCVAGATDIKGTQSMLLIKNGRVLDPARKTDAGLDVLLAGERIAEVAPAGTISAGNAEIFDATGLVVAPGFIDLHAHLREPGQESSETIETGTRAPARGRFTALCSMPNTNPVNDSARGTRVILHLTNGAPSAL